MPAAEPISDAPMPLGREQPRPRTGTGGRSRLDGGSLFRAVLAMAGIVLGLVLEGGSLAQILQPSAALIVFSGTFAAVAVQFPMETMLQALRACSALLWTTSPGAIAQLTELLQLAAKARRSGLVTLDADLEHIQDGFTRRCFMLAVDGTPRQELEQVMTLICDRDEEQEEQAARVWEAAGGFAPTMGILGAVFGLIQVMQRLDNLHGLGQGIAVAFVATLYGVGAANLAFLPIAGRLRLRAAERRQMREAILDAVMQIASGASPRLLRERLMAQTGLVLPADVAHMVSR